MKLSLGLRGTRKSSNTFVRHPKITFLDGHMSHLPVDQSSGREKGSLGMPDSNW